MARARTDQTGLNAATTDLSAAVVEAAAQPICVADRDGVIVSANAAAVAALGYDAAHQLVGRHGHEAIHGDGAPHTAADCPLLLPRTTGETVSSDLDWFRRRDGSLLPVSFVSAPIEWPGGRGAVLSFGDAAARVRGEASLDEHEAILAAQRRVATLVAGGAASAEVFAAIAREVGNVIGLPLVAVWRYEYDRTVTVIGAWSEQPHPFQAGTRWPLDGPTVCARVRETGRPVTIDDFGVVPGTVGDAAREAGIRSAAGAPIIVDGDLWGAMSVDSTDPEPLPGNIEERLAQFTELLATAISNTASREELVRLAEEQAALRRVATLVAQGAPPSELFAAVAEELGGLLGVALAGVLRYETDDTVTVVATSDAAGKHPEAGVRWPHDGAGLAAMIWRTGRRARLEAYDDIPAGLTVEHDELGIRSSVGSPILVEGRLWGALAVHSNQIEALPADTESRLENFTDLVATAVSNVEARADLAASRARIVAAADEERRRVVRDLHDGAQQRLVHAIITLKLAQQADRDEADELTTRALEQAERANVELRELAHGILPAVLTHGGLHAAVDALASRTPVPVENDVSVGRLPRAVEATAYFVVAEALTNVAKHSGAGRAAVTAGVQDGWLRVQVRDDGVGGARPDGFGLVGLADRLAVLHGRLDVESPAGGGTLVAAEIPLGDHPRPDRG